VDVAGYILNGYSTVPPLAADACSNADWIFCDDFESYTVGAHPTQPWLPYASGDHVNYNTWTVETTETRAVSGKKSVHFGVLTSGRAFMMLKAPFPVPNNTFYGRMMMYMQKVPANAHFDYVSAYDGIKESNNNYVWGGQFGTTMANYHPGDCYRHFTGKPVPGKWQCVEWKFDGPNHQMDLWLDDLNQTGLNHSVITNGVGGSGCGNWAPPTAFGALTIGWAHYQTGDDNQNSWIDDLVLDDKRIGCPTTP
jgi:hypothetical protein